MSSLGISDDTRFNRIKNFPPNLFSILPWARIVPGFELLTFYGLRVNHLLQLHFEQPLLDRRLQVDSNLIFLVGVSF